MKTNFWMVLTVAVSTSLFAQTDSNLTPASAAGPVAAAKDANLVPGPATVSGNNVNVRGQAALRGEVITRLNKGDAVTVLEKITLAKTKPGEPAEWVRIAFPTNGHVWVHTSFVDLTNKTVLPKKLNLRAGPGENYSVVGVLERGDAVNEIVTKGDWMEIAAPTDAYAFIAAQYLQQEAAVAAATPAPAPAATAAEATPPAAAPAEPAPAPAIETKVPEQAAVAAPSEPTTTPSAPAAAATAPAVEPVAPAPAVEEQPPPKRVVQREGIVRPTWSVQAPTPFALVSPDTGETINYLYTTSTNLNLKRYKGLRIVVTGEEGLDARWHTPVITIQRIHVVE